eukprot:UN2777
MSRVQHRHSSLVGGSSLSSPYYRCPPDPGHWIFYNNQGGFGRFGPFPECQAVPQSLKVVMVTLSIGTEVHAQGCAHCTVGGEPRIVLFCSWPCTAAQRPRLASSLCQ